MSTKRTCPADHKHGLTTTCRILHGCLCDPCRAADRIRKAERERRRAAGLLPPRVVADPAVQAAARRRLIVRAVADLRAQYNPQDVRISPERTHPYPNDHKDWTLS